MGNKTAKLPRHRGTGPNSRDECGLTPKQKLFCEEYAIDRCGSKAAMRAGYSHSMAHERCSQWIRATREDSKRPEMWDYSQQFIKAHTEAIGVTVEAIQQELAAIAFRDIKDFFNEDDTPKLVHEIPDRARKSVSGVKVRRYYIGKGEDKELVLETEYKLEDKEGALVKLGEDMGMWPKVVKLKGDPDNPLALKGDLSVAMSLRAQSKGLEEIIKRAAKKGNGG